MNIHRASYDVIPKIVENQKKKNQFSPFWPYLKNNSSKWS